MFGLELYSRFQSRYRFHDNNLRIIEPVYVMFISIGGSYLDSLSSLILPCQGASSLKARTASAEKLTWFGALQKPPS